MAYCLVDTQVSKYLWEELKPERYILEDPLEENPFLASLLAS